MLTLEVSASEPQFAADIATAVIEELDRHQQKFKSTRVSEKRQFIEGRINDVQGELRYAEEKLKKFRIGNRQIQNSPSLLLQQERLAREVSVIMGVFTTLKQEHELARYKKWKRPPWFISSIRRRRHWREANPKRDRPFSWPVSWDWLGVGLVFVREYWKNSAKE
jgi:hypothetical protein